MTTSAFLGIGFKPLARLVAQTTLICGDVAVHGGQNRPAMHEPRAGCQTSHPATRKTLTAKLTPLLGSAATNSIRPFHLLPLAGVTESLSGVNASSGRTSVVWSVQSRYDAPLRLAPRLAADGEAHHVRSWANG